ncbi:dihydrodipicolinate synthase family protein [Nitrospinota bacterium]
MDNGVKGIVGAPVTPFTQDNRVDLETFAKQVNFLIENGVHLLAHPMHVGEAPNLTTEERKELAKCLVETADGRVPVFVHVSSAGTDLSIELARHSEKAGATGIVLLPPYYWRPSDEAQLDHFIKVCGDQGLQLICYNNINATHVAISHNTLAHLLERLPGFVGLKDASFNMQYFTEACRVSSEISPDFAMFTGVEYLLLSMPVGGSGAFSGCAEVAPRLTLGLYDACASMDIEKARPLQYKVSQLLNVRTNNQLCTFVKYAMGLMGRPVGETRSPIMPLDSEMKALVKGTLESLGILEEEPRGW